jgi:hypothetical protein
MLNNPIVGSVRVGQRRDQLQSGKHVCIFELERKGALLTAEVVCMVCGVHLSSQQDRLPGTR